MQVSATYDKLKFFNLESSFTVTLEKWDITDNDLFYVMIRNKEQPGQEVFATLPELDHDIGKTCNSVAFDP